MGRHDDLEAMVEKYKVNEIIIASDKIHAKKLEATCSICKEMGVAARNLELSIK